MADQILQLAGAAMILTAFAGAQAGRMDRRSLIYLALNLVGAALLAVDAYQGREWGFFILEAVWTLVSAAGLVGVVRLRRRQSDVVT